MAGWCSAHSWWLQAYLWSILILLLILLSTVTMIMATLPDYDNNTSQHKFFIVETVCISVFTLEV